MTTRSPAAPEKVARLHFDLPEPPALNAMLDLAKKRAGKWSVVYASDKAKYENRAVLMMRCQHKMPRAPWERWRLVSAHFRLWAHRDPIELLAGLKWSVDSLVKGRYVADDSYRHLLEVATPTQEIDRANRGVTIEIEEVL